MKIRKVVNKITGTLSMFEVIELDLYFTRKAQFSPFVSIEFSESEEGQQT